MPVLSIAYLCSPQQSIWDSDLLPQSSWNAPHGLLDTCAYCTLKATEEASKLNRINKPTQGDSGPSCNWAMALPVCCTTACCSSRLAQGGGAFPSPSGLLSPPLHRQQQLRNNSRRPRRSSGIAPMDSGSAAALPHKRPLRWGAFEYPPSSLRCVPILHTVYLFCLPLSHSHRRSIGFPRTSIDSFSLASSLCILFPSRWAEHWKTHSWNVICDSLAQLGLRGSPFCPTGSSSIWVLFHFTVLVNRRAMHLDSAPSLGCMVVKERSVGALGGLAISNKLGNCAQLLELMAPPLWDKLSFW